MRPSLCVAILASAASLFATCPAQAVICYVVYDRSENVIYQNTYPPVDMSSAGAAARDALRKRGEHMTFGDVSACPTMVFLAGTEGSIAPLRDELVPGVPAGGDAMPLMTRSTARAAAAAPAPSAAPKAKTGAY